VRETSARARKEAILVGLLLVSPWHYALGMGMNGSCMLATRVIHKTPVFPVSLVWSWEVTYME
jgi:hypothetical protein